MQVDIRWAASSDGMRMVAKDLVDLQPDVILASGTPATAAFQQQTRTIPIVFVNVVDPVGQGFVASLPHPGGNITGFINIEAGMTGKWLELLTEIAPERQAGRNHVQSRHGSPRQIIFPALNRGSRPITQGGVDRSARSRATPKSNRSSPRLDASRVAASSSVRMASC